MVHKSFQFFKKRETLEYSELKKKTKFGDQLVYASFFLILAHARVWSLKIFRSFKIYSSVNVFGTKVLFVRLQTWDATASLHGPPRPRRQGLAACKQCKGRTPGEYCSLRPAQGF